jgi:ACS family glucarate transporter-like MFS transporter
VNEARSKHVSLPLFGLRGLLVFWMFVLSAIAYVDRVNISIAGQAIAKEFHLTNIQLGWVFSAFVLGYALFQAPAGSLADHIGPRLALAFGVLWWGVFSAAVTLVSAHLALLIPCLIAIRFLLGAGEAVVYPATNCVVSRWIPSSERGIANGIIFAGVGFGAAVTPPVITLVLLRYGWRASFWLSALAGIAAGLVWFLIARDSPAEHPWASAEEKAFIRADPSTHECGPGIQRLSWSNIVGNRNVQAITLSYFTYGYVTYIFFSWFFIYLSAVRGLSLRQSSYYTSLPFLAMGIGAPLGGWMSDRLTRRFGKRVGRCGLACVAMTLCGLFIALGTQVTSLVLATVVLAGGVGALYVSQSSFWSVSADLGKESAGSLSGVMNMGCQLGGAITASLTPAIANRFGWTTSFVVSAALCVAGGMLWLAVDPEGAPERTYGAADGEIRGLMEEVPPAWPPRR